MIEINRISKNFEDKDALKDITFRISDETVLGMVGSNGAGKSTILRLLAGIYRQDEGTIQYDGIDVYDNPEIKKDIVYVGDDLYFLQGSNIKRMAELYASVYENFDYDKLNKLLEIFKLNPYKNISDFSKGMKRQMATILALCTNCKYMFFDETFDGLDPVIRTQVKRLIAGEVVKHKATVIITSHSLRELEDICDHLALLHEGRLVLDSDIMDLKTNNFKVQIAFSEEFDKSKFEGIEVISYKQQGKVAQFIAKGDREHTIQHLNQLNPVLLEILPLTLEEVFIYEMEERNYTCIHQDLGEGEDEDEL